MRIDRKIVSEAADRILGYVRHTPVIRGEIGGLPVTLKLELLQHTGSFKPRGVFNRLLAALQDRPVSPADTADRTPSLPSGVLEVSESLKASGVIAASGGNHGAAVAYVARSLGIRAEVFVPATTPAAKLARIASYDAKITQHGTTYAEALGACRARQTQTGALEIHAYDDAHVLAGQGTVGREFEQAAPELTHVLVATGGGGLIGGVAAWYADSLQVISVEPESCPALHDALRAGQPVDAPVGGVAADSLGARQVGALMFPIAQRFVSQAVLVPDEAIRAAQRLLWERFRLMTEPGGATAAAAVLSGRFTAPPGARVGIVVCGGNADPAALAG